MTFSSLFPPRSSGCNVHAGDTSCSSVVLAIAIVQIAHLSLDDSPRIAVRYPGISLCRRIADVRRPQASEDPGITGKTMQHFRSRVLLNGVQPPTRPAHEGLCRLGRGLLVRC